ncbi:MAG: hypothetical protein AAF235_03440 [Planctomycetota bacterium]
MPRTLDIVPILHAEADMGSLAAQLRARMGDAAYEQRQAELNRFWDGLASWASNVAAEGLHVFQDALPVIEEPASPSPLQMVRELAAKGSANHAIIARLATRGATIHGTEDPALLLEEYSLAKAAADAAVANRLPDPRHETRARAVLERRDRYIAARIAQTLPEDAQGVLFLGLLHSVERYLPDDIETRHPVGKPSRRAAS